MTRPRPRSPVKGAPAAGNRPATARNTPAPPHPGRGAGTGAGGPAVSPLHPAFLVALLVTATCIVAATTHQIADTDFWQHLTVGREILSEGKVPNTQLWIWPQHGEPHHPPSWGFRVLLWGFWNMGGMAGLFVWRWLATLAALGLGVVAARRMGAGGFAALLVAGWAVLPMRLRVEPRPETLAFVLLAAAILVHEHLRRGSGPASPWRWPALAVPALALVWANVHISYWMGFALQLFYLADAWVTGRRDANARAWVSPRLMLLALSAAVSFLNPGGLQILMEPVQYWTVWRHERIYQLIGELAPIVWSENVRNLLGVFVAGWPLLILLRAFRRRVDVAEIGIAALFLAQLLTTSRFVSFFMVVAVPFVSRDLAELFAGMRTPRPLASPWARAALVTVLVSGGLALEWGNRLASPGFGVQPMWRPLAACDFMDRHEIRGRGYNHFFNGGYLLWRFFPQRDRLPFMDIHQSGRPEDRDLVAHTFDDYEAWYRLDQRYGFDWVLLDRYHAGVSPSIDAVDADSAFALVFLDDAAALYVRRTGPLAGIARRFEYRILRAGFAGSPAIMAAIADSLARPALRAEIERVKEESPFHAVGTSWEANLLFREGRLAEAREALRATLAIHPQFDFANSRLAEVDLALGRPAEALAAAQRALLWDGENDRLRDIIFATRGRPGPPEEPIRPAELPNGWTTGK